MLEDISTEWQHIRAQAVTAAVRVARTHGVFVTDPEILQDTSNVVVLLRPAPVVARITTTDLLRPDIGTWLHREASVVEHLVRRGAPVVPPSPELPSGPQWCDGMWITFWQHITHDPDREPTDADLHASLDELHRALADYPGDLPYLGVVLDEIPAVTDLIERYAIVEATDVALFRAAYERLAPLLLADRTKAQALHGDAHPRNVLSTHAGLLWNDFEDTCAGPVAWDRATIAHWHYRTRQIPRELRTHADARWLQGVVWTLAQTHERPEHGPRARDYLNRWRAAQNSRSDYNSPENMNG